jgi:CRISPR/Cas system-associated exonuclease Cas4 (RecB family)
MSKLFFDNLIALEEVEVEIKKSASSPEDREEKWQLVDRTVSAKVLKKTLDMLPEGKRDEFTKSFLESPHDEKKLLDYLKENVGENVEEKLKEDLKDLGSEILREIKISDEMSSELKLPKK